MAGLSDNALTVLTKRYLRRDESGEPIEGPEDMFRRVAANVALMDILYHPEAFCRKGEGGVIDDGDFEAPKDLSPYDVKTLHRAYSRLSKRGHMKVSFSGLLDLARRFSDDTDQIRDRFYQAMIEGQFMPNSPTLMNAGRELQQLSACFVLPIEDEMESIFETLKSTALIHKSGGGTGFSFSRLRPKADQVRSTGGIASGPVSFLKVYDSATEAVKQGGTRRGANMGILRVDHPDIEEFISCKGDDGQIANFNISVGLTSEFMEALEAGGDYALVNPRSGEAQGRLSARDVFDRMVEMAWKNGEPGIVFLDRINEGNPTPQLGVIESTNPCGEQPLLPYESCNLLSLNLSHVVSDDGIDYEQLGDLVHVAVHFLDNVIDANRFPLEAIGDMTLKTRKIGLGIMGWAEVLIRLGIPYDSDEGVALASEVMRFIRDLSRDASRELARVRGPFPAFSGSVYEQEGLPEIRNATTTTIAPTGTISIIAGTSSGIEPLFSLAFTRHVMDGEKLVEMNSLLEETSRQRGFYSPEFLADVAEQGTVRDMEDLPDDVKRVFVTAMDIDPDWHIRMQAAFQEYTDNAVSKTCNFPNSATREDVAGVYRLAYDLGCKGVTVYRDGSRETQVLNVGKKDDDKAPDAHKDRNGSVPWGRIRPMERGTRLQGVTERKATPMGNLWLTLNTYDGHPFELFAQIGKAGSDVTAFTEGLARLISLLFRCGVDPWDVANQLVGIGGSRSVGFGSNRVRSVPDAIGQFIAEYLEKMESPVMDEQSPGQKELSLSPSPQQLGIEGLGTAGKELAAARTRSGLPSFTLCPACGTYSFMFAEGCATCVSCGHSEC